MKLRCFWRKSARQFELKMIEMKDKTMVIKIVKKFIFLTFKYSDSFSFKLKWWSTIIAEENQAVWQLFHVLQLFIKIA